MTGAATLLAKGSGVSWFFGNSSGCQLSGHRAVWGVAAGNFLAWVSLADQGLGSSLTNLVATADAEDDLAKIRHRHHLPSNYRWDLYGVAGGYPLIDWQRLFDLQDALIATQAA
jgi:hypothetical protein